MKKKANKKAVKTFPMESVITHWHCENTDCVECGEDIDWPVSYFQNNGEPICSNCDRDMALSGTVSIRGS